MNRIESREDTTGDTGSCLIVLGIMFLPGLAIIAFYTVRDTVQGGAGQIWDWDKFLPPALMSVGVLLLLFIYGKWDTWQRSKQRLVIDLDGGTIEFIHMDWRSDRRKLARRRNHETIQFAQVRAARYDSAGHLHVSTAIGDVCIGRSMTEFDHVAGVLCSLASRGDDSVWPVEKSRPWH